MATRLLLLGTGLPHLVVLEALGRHRASGARTTVVSDERHLVHPGMVPGFLAGRYQESEIGLDLAQAAAAAGAEFVEGRVRTIHPMACRVALEDGATLDYQVASIAPNPSHRGVEFRTPSHAHGVGSLEKARMLAAALDSLGATPRPEPRRIVILGATELGVELALAARARLDRQRATDVIISILESRSELFGGRLRAWAERVERVLAERDIILRLGTGATEVGSDFVRLSDGRVQPADLVLTAPAAAAWPPLKASGLPVDGHGHLLLDETLQVQGSPAHFGAGPGTALVAGPKTAFPASAQLRMGRVLARNLALAVAGHEPTHRFRARERELTLLDIGDGRAVLLAGPVATVSRLALRYKQMGDRRLIARLRGGA